MKEMNTVLRRSTNSINGLGRVNKCQKTDEGGGSNTRANLNWPLHCKRIGFLRSHRQHHHVRLTQTVTKKNFLADRRRRRPQNDAPYATHSAETLLYGAKRPTLSSAFFLKWRSVQEHQQEQQRSRRGGARGGSWDVVSDMAGDGGRAACLAGCIC